MEAEQPREVGGGESGSIKWALDCTSFPHPLSPRYALASHFFWGLWSTLQASMSTIEFGYLVSKPYLPWALWVGAAEQHMSPRESGLSLVALGRVLLAGHLTVHYGFRSLGVRPISVPVLLPAEGAANQLPITLRIQPPNLLTISTSCYVQLFFHRLYHPVPAILLAE